MQAAQIIAGHDTAEPISSACHGQEDQAVMDAQKDVFIQGAKDTNIDRKNAEAIFALLEKFAEYGFIKSYSGSLRHAQLPNRLPQGESPRLSSWPLPWPPNKATPIKLPTFSMSGAMHLPVLSLDVNESGANIHPRSEGDSGSIRFD